MFSSIQNVRCYRTKDLSNENYEEGDLALFRYKRNDNVYKANLSFPLQQPKANKLISNLALGNVDQTQANSDEDRPIFQAPEWKNKKLVERLVFAEPLNGDVSKLLIC